MKQHRKRRMVPGRIIVFVICCYLAWLLLGSSCSEGESPGVVARVGKEKITFEELDRSFKLNPRYAIRTPLSKARLSQLNFLIDGKYYLLAAKEANLQEDTLIARRIQYIRDKETIKAYIQDKFINQVQVSDTALLRALAKFERKIRVQNLYAPTRQEAEVLRARLMKGESFTDLAREVYSEESLAESGGDMGFITFGEVDPQVEKRIYSLEIGEISEPVQSAFGYHILKVTDIQPNEEAASMDSYTKTKYVTDRLKNRLVDQAVRTHLKELSENQKIQVNNRVLDVLVQATSKVMDDRYENPTLFVPPIRSGDLDSIRLGVGDVLGETLVKFGERKMNVAEFLKKLRQMPPYHRPYLGTRKRMIQAIIDLIRNDLILEEARRLGYDQQDAVKQRYDKFIEDMLASEMKHRLRSLQFKSAHPQKWEEYNRIFTGLKQKIKPKINRQALFPDVANPDSVMAPTPIYVFLKDRYVW
ncbi:MAG: hypothetical protein Kow0042_02600 [Calditrichia bacterium]